MNFEWTDLWLFFSGIGSLGGIIVAFVALSQLKSMREALDDTRRWNKLNSAFSYLPKSHEFIEIEKELNNSFIEIIDRNTPLTSEETTKLFDASHKGLRIQLKSYLNLLESFCTAIKMGAVDEDAARELYRHKFKRHFQELQPFIAHMRSTHNDNEIYASLEFIVNRWEQRVTVPKKY